MTEVTLDQDLKQDEDQTEETYPILDKYDLSPKQIKAIDYKLSGHSHKEIADNIGVSEVTISRWWNNDSDFADAYNEKQQQIFEGNANRLEDLITHAVSVIEDKVKVDGDIDSAFKLFDLLGVAGQVHEIAQNNKGDAVRLSESEQTMVEAFRKAPDQDTAIDMFLEFIRQSDDIEMNVNKVVDIESEE